MPPVETVEPAVKGAVMRGFAAALRREGVFDKVRAFVSDDAGELLDNPPPASAWIERRRVLPIYLAIERVGGLPLTRKITREAVLLGLIPVVRLMVDGFLRLFGATPHTILSRMNDLSKSSGRGSEYEYVRTSDHSGTLTVRYVAERNVAPCVYAVAAGGFEAMLDVVGVKGTVGEPVTIADNAVRFVIEWKPRK